MQRGIHASSGARLSTGSTATIPTTPPSHIDVASLRARFASIDHPRVASLSILCVQSAGYHTTRKPTGAIVASPFGSALRKSSVASLKRPELRASSSTL